MAESPEAAANGADAQPQVGILAQYVKDLSFENPNAPQSLQAVAQQQPKIDVNVNVNGRKVAEDTYEVALRIQASAMQDEAAAFVADLTYSGLFAVRNVPDDQLQVFLLVEAPRIIFPFARRILADTTRDGGFPPLLLDPIDFGQLYMQRQQQVQQEAQKAAGVDPNGVITNA